MYDPPAGYVDLLTDAETALTRDVWGSLEIPTVGTLRARRPTPASVANLAATSRPRTDRATQGGHLELFVLDHLDDAYIDNMCEQMMRSQLPEDTLGLIARGIATWGTARPYLAVCTLAAITGHHWRTIRCHLITHGIPDPMSLPSMHALLDVTETLVVESIQEDKPAATRRKRTQFFDSIYKPEIVTVTGTTKAVVPAGFEDTDMEDAFDRFAGIATPRR